jgi:hypothetical protein
MTDMGGGPSDDADQVEQPGSGPGATAEGWTGHRRFDLARLYKGWSDVRLGFLC